MSDEDVNSMTQDELRNVLAAKNFLVPTMKTLRTIVSEQLRDQPGSHVDPLLTNITICEQNVRLGSCGGGWMLDTSNMMVMFTLSTHSMDKYV